MKKIVFIIMACLFFVSGCGKEEVKPMLLPTDVISLEEAQALIGDSYTLKMKNDAVVQDENLLSVKYLSEPLGTGDGVFIELLTPDENHAKSVVKDEFSKSRDKRSDRILVKGLGDDAYITYPTLHLYTHDLYVTITAGSKSSDEQADLLIELGKIAQKNIDDYFAQ